MDLNEAQNNNNKHPTRRDLLQGMVALTASLAAGSVLAGAEHVHHAESAATPNTLVQAALDCVKAGQTCTNHCIGLFKRGDTSTAACMAAVTEMLAMCTALSQMASYNSVYLPALASVCAKVCQNCEQECRKHENKHSACKACAESCAHCITECEKVAA